ncbi:sensor histidine kinase [Streptomyces iconiensis]|uniref:Histidine kinase n=1 Tax=Streptomyces iconiensis TaxID=1384038 RepID=A0ABT6ZZX3_9ACTN|nr:histidine kinase [Streptomyces iconiensis]MDJ1133948.1 histidine kinase [Streptomyces iconiensis]
MGSRQRDHEGPDTRSASRIALILLVVTLFGFLSSATLHLLTIGGSLLQIVGGTAALVGLFVTQIMRSAPRSSPLRRKQIHTLLWVQAVLVYAPVAVMGPSWVSLPGLLAGSVLLSLRRPWSWILTLAIWGSVFWLTAWYGFEGMEGVYIGVSSMTTTAMVCGLTLLSQMVMRLRAAQQEIARLAVEEERLRFARDLHDLLGYSLSAITLRSELAHRLVDGNPVRAKNEVTSVLEVSRQALADVRAVARSYRNISLPAEVSSAVSVFEAAGIEAEVDTSLERIPEAVGTVLATVLREGVTNILRHSKVRKCAITVTGDAGCAVLRLVNDGVQPRPDPADPTTPAPDAEGGSGIGNLSARVGAIGGRLSAREEDDGCFHLVARVPLTPSSRPGDPGAHPRLSSAV